MLVLDIDAGVLPVIDSQVILCEGGTSEALDLRRSTTSTGMI